MQSINANASDRPTAADQRLKQHFLDLQDAINQFYKSIECRSLSLEEACQELNDNYKNVSVGAVKPEIVLLALAQLGPNDLCALPEIILRHNRENGYEHTRLAAVMEILAYELSSFGCN